MIPSARIDAVFLPATLCDDAALTVLGQVPPHFVLEGTSYRASLALEVAIRRTS